METLTKKQNEILNFMKRYIAEHGFPPTIREIGSALGVNSPATIHAHLNNLEKKGAIKKNGYKNRAIELLVANEYVTPLSEFTVEIPLLGKITAGNPIEAIEQPNEVLAIPSYLVPRDKEVFSLKVSGTSMINAGILDGDIVIVERVDTARNGQMIVAMTDEKEVTLKTFYKEEDHFRLQPENDTMDPILLDHVTILGKAIGLYRKI